VIHLLLFDIDGVLVLPRAYLKALQDTVSYVARQIGVDGHPPSEEDQHAFEANGLSSEWDMGAAVVGVLLLDRLRLDPPAERPRSAAEGAAELPGEWGPALQFLAAHPRPLDRPDYVALAERIGRRVSQGLRPAAAARATLWEEALAVPGLSAVLPALSGLLDTLFCDTRSFYHSPVTRVFQHMAIGSTSIARTYGVAPELQSPAYLELFDEPLLAPEVRQKLEQVGDRLRLALYTLRPSLPPAETGPEAPPLKGALQGLQGGDQGLGYAPEAEMGRGRVGLGKWPVIGLGHIQWLAQQNGVGVNLLVKPGPVQALAAIAAAWSGQEMAALQAALALHQERRLPPPLDTLRQAVVHVFEDTCEGIASVQQAVELLQAAGVDANWRAYGIASPASSKASALAGCGARVYPSVNEAVMAMLQHV